ncbi:hypothetical protein RCL_jg2631.t1 [Rhizophagus clarus]|uniref:Uncharacterized protein n=1 Tax=Rhizophagus clarus TaxID=94130 RepID=A0A8H3QQT7_9GLOM|nr:hypothetical protein RCL_jg2631.t1 [Rhizophagus clarus]
MNEQTTIIGSFERNTDMQFALKQTFDIEGKRQKWSRSEPRSNNNNRRYQKTGSAPSNKKNKRIVRINLNIRTRFAPRRICHTRGRNRLKC